MRRIVPAVFAAVFATWSHTAATGQNDVQAIIDKAISAHGGTEKLQNLKGVQLQSQGSIVGTPFGTIKFNQDATALFSGKVKEVMKMNAMNMDSTVTTVFDGTKGWTQMSGQKPQDLDERMLSLMKDAVYMWNLDRMIPLKDPACKLAALGQVTVNNRPAVGIRISSEGHKDVSFYFDKQTGLLAKVVHPTTDAITGKEVTEERILLEYQEVDGVKTAKREEVYHDGKKFMEAEVLQYRLVDNIDEKELQKPN
jgi:hypothetical protein